VNDSTANLCPAALRQMLDKEPAQPPVALRVTLRSRWASLATWTPSDEQLRRAADWLVRACDICDMVLKTAVIAAVTFLAIEIGEAFLPGGAVSRVLGGVK
jgi:hypothetical protein